MGEYKITHELDWLSKRKPVSSFCVNGAERKNLPCSAGLYAFCIDKKIIEIAPHFNFKVAGPNGKKGNDVEMAHKYDQPTIERGVVCLYVGRATNLQQRFRQHLLQKKQEFVHEFNGDGPWKKPTTTCQLRFGMERMFRGSNEVNVLDLIYKHVYFCFVTEKCPQERFYRENFLIGHLRPWFNVDSER